MSFDLLQKVPASYPQPSPVKTCPDLRRKELIFGDDSYMMKDERTEYSPYSSHSHRKTSHNPSKKPVPKLSVRAVLQETAIPSTPPPSPPRSFTSMMASGTLGKLSQGVLHPPETPRSVLRIMNQAGRISPSPLRPLKRFAPTVSSACLPNHSPRMTSQTIPEMSSISRENLVDQEIILSIAKILRLHHRNLNDTNVPENSLHIDRAESVFKNETDEEADDEETECNCFRCQGRDSGSRDRVKLNGRTKNERSESEDYMDDAFLTPRIVRMNNQNRKSCWERSQQCCCTHPLKLKETETAGEINGKYSEPTPSRRYRQHRRLQSTTSKHFNGSGRRPSSTPSSKLPVMSDSPQVETLPQQRHKSQADDKIQAGTFALENDELAPVIKAPEGWKWISIAINSPHSTEFNVKQTVYQSRLQSVLALVPDLDSLTTFTAFPVREKKLDNTQDCTPLNAADKSAQQDPIAMASEDALDRVGDSGVSSETDTPYIKLLLARKEELVERLRLLKLNDI